MQSPRLEPPVNAGEASALATALTPAGSGPAGHIRHIVVIVQENRTVDNLFQSLPGARTQSWGYNSHRQKVSLRAEPLTAPYDVEHNHFPSWRDEYADGAMDGFNLAPSHCFAFSTCPPAGQRAYAYVPEPDVAPYYSLAEQYTFADEMFQSNQGPSFPAHQYILSGTSTVHDGARDRASENPGNGKGGCDSPNRSRVWLIDLAGLQRRRVFPCFTRTSVLTLLDADGISWKYYQANTGSGVWHAVDALEPIWSRKLEYASHVVDPPGTVLNDIAGGKLPSVVFVTPTGKASDHPGVTDGTGPSWVASVVNAVGKSAYWNDSAIIVTWDDWGGWYDHVKPVMYNSYELGFRVPLIVISPYAKTAYVSHVPYEFGSILKFVEETFNLGSLGTTDLRATDLSDCFTFAVHPRRFGKIRAPYSAKYFLRQPLTNQPPDKD